MGLSRLVVVKLHIFDEIVAVRRITETEIVRLNHFIFDVNLGVKQMTFCINANSNCCHMQLRAC